MAAQAQPPLVNLQDLPCFRCSFTQEFHDTVIRSLERLNGGQEAIAGRLDKINGSVAELFRRTNNHAEKIAVLEETIKTMEDLRDAVRGLERAIDQQKASARTASTIFSEVRPLIWSFLGACMLLILINAKNVLAMFGH